jgi:hypothetical protein
VWRPDPTRSGTSSGHGRAPRVHAGDDVAGSLRHQDAACNDGGFGQAREESGAAGAHGRRSSPAAEDDPLAHLNGPGNDVPRSFPGQEIRILGRLSRDVRHESAGSYCLNGAIRDAKGLQSGTLPPRIAGGSTVRIHHANRIIPGICI